MSAELAELRKISKILILANAKAIENELSKYATTDERKKVWVLIDGKRMSKDIAQLAGIKRRAVDVFLQTLETAGLIENPRGKPPKKYLITYPLLGSN
ncbi:hypothetical protein J7K27_04770 [Candidatus Bathyarchaeota archaeon]|nr:hypothetical protein [Candidatus Bathyarchaeota archaeon]